MADNITDVVHELSGILRRISDQRDQFKLDADEARGKALKNIELLSQAMRKESADPCPLREPAMDLDHQLHLLDELIARLREVPRKG